MSQLSHNPRLLPSAEEYVQGVLRGDRAMLGRTITLIESEAAQHRDLALDVLHRLLPHSGGALRIGITGVPGVGKSTLIEALGMMLCEAGKHVAVLAVDPSSSQSHGSILGDKTRMDRLSQAPNAFIRPSPTSGTLGGVTRKTRESIVVCEAAGYDLVLIETVGVGQSETMVRSMTDCFVLLALAGAGDELQAIKKGIVELADLIVITKADGTNREKARAAGAEYRHALRYLTPSSEWVPRVLSCSAQTGAGLPELWDAIEQFRQAGEAQGWLHSRRQMQAHEWLSALIQAELERRFYEHPSVAAQLPLIEQAVISGQLSAVEGAAKLLETVSLELPEQLTGSNNAEGTT